MPSGCAGGATCYLAVTKLKAWLGYDDSLDVFGVHGVGSTVGLLLLVFFANPAANGAIATTFKSGGQVISLAGGRAQFKNQLVGVLFAAALAAGATFMILKLVGLIIDLRISAEDEHSGLDLTRHGESAYND